MKSISGHLESAMRVLNDKYFDTTMHDVECAVADLCEALKVLEENIREVNSKLDQVISYTGKTFYENKNE
ncbi:MAG: hypothetical protein HC836_39100 [Richelia sp. RM2_1_2]|nr:hypothetical protein [Richelia sp. RM2_1_2]